MLGCKPKGRLTEQHDIFFGIANSLKELVPKMLAFWPEANGIMHIDAWREITMVDGYTIEVVAKNSLPRSSALFFINLGGYKPNEFEEYHYKLLTVAPAMAAAIRKSKTTVFYKHFGFEGAVSHVDDKYGIDMDDAYNVEDILGTLGNQYSLQLSEGPNMQEDVLHIGYLQIAKLLKDGSQ